MAQPRQLSQERILLVRLSAIGDVIMCSAVAENIKRHYHGTHITWLASPPAADILRHNPYIDRLLVWDRRPLDAAFARRRFGTVYKELKKVREIFRPFDFDLAIDLQSLLLTGIITYLSGAPRRIGIHDRHEGGSLFMTEMAPKIANPHRLCRYMTALNAIGIDEYSPQPTVSVTADMRKDAQRFWLNHNIDPAKPILMVSIRTSAANKNWPPDRFGAALLSVPGEVQIVFCGTAQDIPYIKKAQQYVRGTWCIAGETSLVQLAGLLASAKLLLTADSGPLHLAEAVGTKTISLWGPTRPEDYGPLTKGHEFIIGNGACVGCQKLKCKKKTYACIKSIEPEIVRDKLREMLEVE